MMEKKSSSCSAPFRFPWREFRPSAAANRLGGASQASRGVAIDATSSALLRRQKKKRRRHNDFGATLTSWNIVPSASVRSLNAHSLFLSLSIGLGRRSGRATSCSCAVEASKIRPSSSRDLESNKEEKY